MQGFTSIYKITSGYKSCTGRSMTSPWYVLEKVFTVDMKERTARIQSREKRK